MEIYNYHPKTHEFLSKNDARPSPMETGGYLIPAQATTTAPPSTGENEVAVFDPVTESWEIQADYRGAVFYSTADGREAKVEAIGPLADVQPPNTTDEPMPLAPAGKKTVWDGEGWTFEDLPPPTSVTMRQARLALKSAGLYEQVSTMVAAIEGDVGDSARIEWEFATEVRRDNPLYVKLAGELGLSDAQLDALFSAAAAL
ncbi:MAG: hypothetical protein LBL72_08340 [Candidatus Accumulibacter sp.]|jgi:hypothetical protein|nr:hypothetical protein [Accumulibacter sp.]